MKLFNISTLDKENEWRVKEFIVHSSFLKKKTWFPEENVS